MELTTAILCDVAHIRDGLIYILGGGVTRVVSPHYPGTLNIALALVIDLESSELGRPHAIEIFLVCADQGTVHNVTMTLNTMVMDQAADETSTCPAVVPFYGVQIPQAGSYDVQIEIDGKIMKSLAFLATIGG